MAVISGIHGIAIYLNISQITVRKYIKEKNLPIRRLDNNPNAPIFSTSDLLDRWVEEVLVNPNGKKR